MATWHDYLKKEGTAPTWPYPIRYEEEQEIEADVLVIGGGIAGCWAAIAAAREGLSVTLVEKGDTIRSGAGGPGCDLISRMSPTTTFQSKGWPFSSLVTVTRPTAWSRSGTATACERKNMMPTRERSSMPRASGRGRLAAASIVKIRAPGANPRSLESTRTSSESTASGSRRIA